MGGNLEYLDRVLGIELRKNSDVQIEYTYFFETGDFWHEADFYTGDGSGMSDYIEVDNALLSSFVLREKGFPFRGEGYVEGFASKTEKHISIFCAKHFIKFGF